MLWANWGPESSLKNRLYCLGKIKVQPRTGDIRCNCSLWVALPLLLSIHLGYPETPLFLILGLCHRCGIATGIMLEELLLLPTKAQDQVIGVGMDGLLLLWGRRWERKWEEYINRPDRRAYLIVSIITNFFSFYSDLRSQSSILFEVDDSFLMLCVCLPNLFWEKCASAKFDLSFYWYLIC